ncbi:hypothetical protein CEV34_4780 [Brucella pseudogrignonensis]|uniref:Uncharacterized protein n=1 Tax=Brucella pseudogrignonensis TaxID=419475 RepID=A0A256G4G5_9HYPH|nr:hypothetical protein CEV34_4780 [Brucella pseudogrignonensis]
MSSGLGIAIAGRAAAAGARLSIRRNVRRLISDRLIDLPVLAT